MEQYRSPCFVKSWKHIEAHKMIEKWSNKQIQLHKKAQQEVH